MPKKKRKPPGPKPMPASQRRSQMFTLRLTNAEKRQVKKLPTDVARDVLLKAAQMVWVR